MAGLVSSDDGVSEAVGYLIITGVIVTAIAIAYVLGYPTLQNMIGNGHLQNMERGFIVLGNNVDRIMEQSTPMQSTELNIQGGTLMNVQGGMINISCYDKYGNMVTMGGTGPESWDITTIIYDYPGSRAIGYECGGTMERFGASGVVLKAPKMVVGDPFIIPIVDVFGSGVNKGGTGLVKVMVYGGESNLIGYDRVKYVNISVSSEFYFAWAAYFEDLGLDANVDSANKIAYGNYTAPPDKPDGISVIMVNKPIVLEIL